jgi:hypothetical protein
MNRRFEEEIHATKKLFDKVEKRLIPSAITQMENKLEKLQTALLK